MSKRRVLFVDDEVMLLQGLRRMLRGLRDEWEMVFVTSGREALQLMAQQPFDVVVTDMRMPEMDGVALLTEVKNRHPDVVRIVLSGHADTEYILKSVNVAHQFLSKPCDSDVLKHTVNRACALQSFLTDPNLKQLVSGLHSLPSLPETYHRLMQELQSEDPSVQKVARIISQDSGMAAKILQIVNSAFFGLKREVSNPALAVSLLGLENIKALVLTIEIFRTFEQLETGGYNIENEFRHSLMSGRICRDLAKLAALEKKEIEAAFLSGLFHDIGKLILVTNLGGKYSEIVDRVKEQGLSYFQAEQQVLGATHAQVGAYLLGLWGIPDLVVEAVAFHHRPEQLRLPDIHLALVAHVGDWIAHQMEQPEPATDEEIMQKELSLQEPVQKRFWGWYQELVQQFQEV